MKQAIGGFLTALVCIWLYNNLLDYRLEPDTPPLISSSELLARLQAGDHTLRLVETVAPQDTEIMHERIAMSRRTWRSQYELPTSDEQPIVGLAPTALQFEELMRSLGIDDNSEVVLIDRGFDATRLWWLFHCFGKWQGVRILDGGYWGWLGKGLPTTAEAPPAVRGNFRARKPRTSLIASRDDVMNLRDRRYHRLWDVRSHVEHAGMTTLPGAKTAGRVPWTNGRIDWETFRNSKDGFWLDTLTMRATGYAALNGSVPDDGIEHTFYSQTGIRTTQIIFGLHLAGWPLERLKNYDGSWIEWSRDPNPDNIHVEYQREL